MNGLWEPAACSVQQARSTAKTQANFNSEPAVARRPSSNSLRLAIRRSTSGAGPARPAWPTRASQDRDPHVDRGIEIHGVEQPVAVAEAEHSGQEPFCQVDRLGAEEDPAGDHGQQRIGPAEDGGRASGEADQADAFHHQQHAVVQAPEHERPAGPVPQAAEEEDGQQVEIDPRLRDPAAAQRDVDVVAEPGGERDVPAPPEVLHGAGDVGIVEVLDELEAQHPPQPDGHVRVAREIEVDLQRVGDRAEPGQAKVSWRRAGRRCGRRPRPRCWQSGSSCPAR